ncbi:MAG: hypothetical protein AB7N70_34755, partial [Dehalococcoidia bacterium]
SGGAPRHLIGHVANLRRTALTPGPSPAARARGARSNLEHQLLTAALVRKPSATAHLGLDSVALLW